MEGGERVRRMGVEGGEGVGEGGGGGEVGGGGGLLGGGRRRGRRREEGGRGGGSDEGRRGFKWEFSLPRIDFRRLMDGHMRGGDWEAVIFLTNLRIPSWRITSGRESTLEE